MWSRADTGILIEVHSIGKVSPEVAVDAVVINNICEAMQSGVVPYYNWFHISNIQLADPESQAPREDDILLGSCLLF